MKKLMFASALAVCAAVHAEIASDVVGYQKLDTNSGFTYLSSSFQKVGGGTLALADLVPAGEDAGFGGEAIQTFDDTNDVTGFYTYYVEDSGLASDGNGWYDDDGNLADVELGTGIGVLFESDAAQVQVSGVVTQGIIDITELNDGFTYVCNPTPVAKSIQAFVPTGDNAGFGGEAIQTFDETNDVTGFYTYYIEDSGLAPEGNGWYDDDGNLADETFDPGIGFLLQSAGDCTVKVAGAL